MTIEFDINGNAVWHFYRKSYRKSRWQKVGQRILDFELKHFPGYSGLIIVK